MALKRSPRRPIEANTIVGDVNKLARYTCCTYDQVNKRIIELLDKTSGAEETDLALSKAYVDELQQKPIPGVESEQAIATESSISRHETAKTIKLPKSDPKSLKVQPKGLLENEGSASEVPSDIEEKEFARQQIERQISVNSSLGRRWTESLSSYFGQPVKLTASIAR